MSMNVRVCIIVLFVVNIVNGDVIVETTSGKVAGRQVESILPDEKYYSFLGIPYAKPPTDKLRFMVSRNVYILKKFFFILRYNEYVLHSVMK